MIGKVDLLLVGEDDSMCTFFEGSLELLLQLGSMLSISWCRAGQLTRGIMSAGSEASL